MAARRHKSTQPALVEYFDGMKADYSAAKASRYKKIRTGIAPSGSHGDYHYRNERDFLKILEYARDMERNDGLIGAMLTQAATVTLLEGIEVQPTTGLAKLDKALGEEWDGWALDAERCDVAGERNFYEMQFYAFRQMLLDGDIVALLRDDGKLQHIEAHRVRTPNNTRKNVVHGVLLDQDRKRLEYWICREDLDPSQTLQSADGITARPVRDADGERVLAHLYNSKRFSQTRGVSALAPVFDFAGFADDLQFAKLVQQQVASCFAIFRERTADYDGLDDEDGADQTGERSSTRRRDGSTETVDNIAPGMQVVGARGEKLSGFSSNVPNAEFFEQLKITLQQISVNLGLPLAYVLLDGSETNFSGWRGATEVAKMGWRRNQQEICAHYICPIYRWRVRWAIASDPAIAKLAAQCVRAGGDPFAHRPHCPTWPYMQPVQDRAADLLELGNSLVSPRAYYLARNLDPDQVVAETIDFNEKAIRAAMEKAAKLAADFPDVPGPTWRDLWRAPSAQGINISLNGGDAPAANTGGAAQNG